jgi:hypothetical protein
MQIVTPPPLVTVMQRPSKHTEYIYCKIYTVKLAHIPFTIAFQIHISLGHIHTTYTYMLYVLQRFQAHTCSPGQDRFALEIEENFI